jgi:hypothetical protein
MTDIQKYLELKLSVGILKDFVDANYTKVSPDNIEGFVEVLCERLRFLFKIYEQMDK